MPTVTTSAFERSHGKAPRGFGTWAFAPSTTRVAFEADVDHDAVTFVTATFTEARRSAVRHFHTAAFVAVMP